MPTIKHLEKMAATVRRSALRSRLVGPGDEIPPEYWAAILDDARADAGSPAPSIRTKRLSEIGEHVLRVSCSKCARTVEIQRADAVRLYGLQAVWKDCAQRLLDDTCQIRTGRYEEDGC
jgi:hypothetical protein